MSSDLVIMLFTRLRLILLPANGAVGVGFGKGGAVWQTTIQVSDAAVPLTRAGANDAVDGMESKASGGSNYVIGGRQITRITFIA